MFGIAIIHAIAFLVGIGYAQNYYFHLRKSGSEDGGMKLMFVGHHKNNAH